VRTCAERAARIDHDRLHAVRGLLPRWPDPEPADDDAVVERTPAVHPSCCDLRRLYHPEALPHASLDRLVVGIDGEAAVELLDAAGEELEEPRELGLTARDDETPQRNALFSFSKKLSSALYVLSSLQASNSSSRRRWSSFR
jgi:hypothetical protein